MIQLIRKYRKQIALFFLLAGFFLLLMVCLRQCDKEKITIDVSPYLKEQKAREDSIIKHHKQIDDSLKAEILNKETDVKILYKTIFIHDQKLDQSTPTQIDSMYLELGYSMCPTQDNKKRILKTDFDNVVKDTIIKSKDSIIIDLKERVKTKESIISATESKLKLTEAEVQLYGEKLITMQIDNKKISRKLKNQKRLKWLFGGVGFLGGFLVGN